ncbi:MAG: dienelactone hydrolase family protein, partial [Pyrinomonadaceae bacterium]|nr:dienelactone hydrolase family protein [Pyrinomonadaceae bacterium]
YGPLVPRESSPRFALQPKYPIDVAADLKAPVLGLYGAKDKGISVDTVEQMRAKLKEAKSKSEIIVYPNADHGFHADYRASYSREDAADGWQRLQAWFKRHGAA